MASIRVDSPIPISDGQVITFKSPTDCSTVTGLIIYYTENEVETSRSFKFADAHGNNVGGIDLFAANVLVKVILDVTNSRAYVQNADTNKYIEETFLKKSTDIDMKGHRLTGLPLPESGSEPATKEFVENFTVEGSTYVATDDNKDGNIVLRPYVADADELEFRDHIKNMNNPHNVNRLPSIDKGTSAEKYIQLCVADMTSTWSRAHATLILTSSYTGTKYTAVISARAYRGSSDITVEFDQLAGKNITDRLFYYVDGSKVYFYYFKPTNEEVYFTCLNADGQMAIEILNVGATLATYTGKATYELGASAPAGYGYGEKAESIGTVTTMADLENAVTPIINKMPNLSSKQVTFVDTTIGQYSAIATVFKHSESTAVVEVRIYATNYMYVKRLTGGVWQPREWVTPPMVTGQEYLTTELWNGKVVYVKRLNLGNLVNNSYDYVEIGSTFSEIVDLKITARASNGSNFVLPMIDTSKFDGKVIAQGWQEGTSIIVLCIGDLSGWIATAVIKYTKD